MNETLTRWIPKGWNINPDETFNYGNPSFLTSNNKTNHSQFLPLGLYSDKKHYHITNLYNQLIWPMLIRHSVSTEERPNGKSYFGARNLFPKFHQYSWSTTSVFSLKVNYLQGYFSRKILWPLSPPSINYYS